MGVIRLHVLKHTEFSQQAAESVIDVWDQTQFLHCYITGHKLYSYGHLQSSKDPDNWLSTSLLDNFYLNAACGGFQAKNS